MKCLNHCHNIIKSSKKGSFILNNCWKYEKNSAKKWSFNNEIKCQERLRMQDFAPFIPELLGALCGPQIPGHKGHRRTAVPSTSICLLLFNLLLLLPWLSIFFAAKFLIYRHFQQCYVTCFCCHVKSLKCFESIGCIS